MYIKISQEQLINNTYKVLFKLKSILNFQVELAYDLGDATYKNPEFERLFQGSVKSIG